MTVSRFRVLAVVVSVLVLGGCGVPGKGDPGTVAVYGDNVITRDDVTELHDAMGELFSKPNTGEDVTLLLIGPGVLAIADQVGIELSGDYIANRAEVWVAYASRSSTGEATTVTSAGLEVVRVVEAINQIMHDPDGTLALIALVQDIENRAVVSPMYGDFTMDSFSESIQTISDYIAANSTELSTAQFVVWKDLNGFHLTDNQGTELTGRPEWISSG